MDQDYDERQLRRQIPMRRPIRTALLAGTAGVITLGGATAAVAVQDSNHKPQTTASASASPSAPVQVSADQARKIAQQHVPGGTVTEIELEHEHGQAVWEVYLTKQRREYEIYISAVTGNIISAHPQAGSNDHRGVTYRSGTEDHSGLADHGCLSDHSDLSDHSGMGHDISMEDHD
jgi:uncharacterized membrane protein YkoI